MRAVLAGACALAAVALAAGVARGDSAHPQTIVFNRSISSVWLGESRSGVLGEWGKGKRVSPLIMEESLNKPVGGLYRYAVPRGHLEVGFYKGRVVYLFTNSPYFETADGIGVGHRIPRAKRITLDGHTFRYAAADTWSTWTNGYPRYPKNARSLPKPNEAFKQWVATLRRRRGTWLEMHKGLVAHVLLMRADLCLDCGA